jgi:hypothetical protein
MAPLASHVSKKFASLGYIERNKETTRFLVYRQHKDSWPKIGAPRRAARRTSTWPWTNLPRAWVSKKTLYKHFPGKEDRLVSMIVRAMRRGEESIGEADPSVPTIEHVDVRHAIAGCFGWRASSASAPDLTRS